MKRLAPPWYKQNRFYVACAAFLFLYYVLVLPGPGPASSTFQALNIGLYVFAVLVFMGWFISDKQKPEWLKTLTVVLVIALYCWMFYLYSGADWSSFFRLFLNFEKMKGRYSTFITPTLLILRMAGYSCVFAVVIGAVLAVFRSFDNPVVTWLVSAYVTFFRAFPAMVLLVLVYYALPYVGIELSSVSAVIVGLTLFYSAYTTEVFRAGIESVHKTQIEAADVMGFSAWQTMRLIIAPQAFRVVIPPLTSQLIGIIKTTSISYVVGVVDLITRARQLQSYLMVVTPLLFVSLIYLLIILPLVFLSGYLERRSRRWLNRVH
jgi:polar amino acid transport system permease protein